MTGTEDTPYVFSWSDFNVQPVQQAPGGSPLSIVVDSLPQDGQLQYYNGTAWAPVTVGQTVSEADINAGFLCFGPDANASGLPGYGNPGFGNLRDDYAQFTYQASDSLKLSATTTMTVDVMPVADTPLLTVGNANGGVGGEAQIFRTSWETAPNRNRNSTILPETSLEGWDAVMPPGDCNNHFVVWSSGDRMKDANNQNETVYADPGDGNNWIELANAAGAGHETIGISRSVTTRAGSNYILSFDYAGRLGYSIDYTQIGIYVDGVQLATYANTSPNTALNWQSLSYSFTGTGQAQTIMIEIESASDSNGRGAMIDNIALTEQQPLNSGYEGSAIRLSPITAALVDTDGSESLSVTLGGLPVGATLSDGVRSFTATSTQSSLEVSGWSLDALSITPPSGFTGSFTLTVTATSTEEVTLGTASMSASLQVTVLSTVSPIVLDLNGDGIHTTALDASGGTFDLLNTGTGIHSGWLSPEDAFLAVDSNHNGIIDDRAELFGGEALGEGYAQLSAYDSNHDGVIDARDAHFEDLLIWQDTNGNHRTDPGELHTLTQAGIVSLSLGYTFEPTEQGGNWLYEVSHATLTDGRQIEMADAYFAVDQAEAAAAVAAQAKSTTGAHTATLTIHSLLNPTAPIIVPQTTRLERPIPDLERAPQAAQARVSLSTPVSPLSAQDSEHSSMPLTVRSSLLSGERAPGGQEERAGESTASPPTPMPPLSDPLTGPWGPWTVAQPSSSTADNLPVIDWSARHDASAHRPEPPLYRPWMASVLGVEPNGSGDLARVTGLRVSAPAERDQPAAG